MQIYTQYFILSWLNIFTELIKQLKLLTPVKIWFTKKKKVLDSELIYPRLSLSNSIYGLIVLEILKSHKKTKSCERKLSVEFISSLLVARIHNSSAASKRRQQLLKTRKFINNPIINLRPKNKVKRLLFRPLWASDLALRFRLLFAFKFPIVYNNISCKLQSITVRLWWGGHCRISIPVIFKCQYQTFHTDG